MSTHERIEEELFLNLFQVTGSDVFDISFDEDELPFEPDKGGRKRKSIELSQYSPVNKKPKLVKLVQNGNEDNVIELKTNLKEIIPPIKFNMIPLHNFNEKSNLIKRLL
nr:4585_t:CDS:2 [Entrophospora candida]